jgi:FG-GAP repeat
MGNTSQIVKETDRHGNLILPTLPVSAADFVQKNQIPTASDYVTEFNRYYAPVQGVNALLADVESKQTRLATFNTDFGAYKNQLNTDYTTAAARNAAIVAKKNAAQTKYSTYVGDEFPQFKISTDRNMGVVTEFITPVAVIPTTGTRLITNVAISRDGNTLAFSSSSNNIDVYVKSNNIWSKQTTLTTLNTAYSVISFSSDGNTIITGMRTDNTTNLPNASNYYGAYVYTRAGTTWSPKILLCRPWTSIYSASGSLRCAVSLSADGSTAVVGSPTDAYNHQNGTGVGAAYVFTKNGSEWTQQARLVANDSVDYPAQGISTSMSSDGNTLFIGGSEDSRHRGAVWLWTRSGEVWTQQTKFVPYDAVGTDMMMGFGKSISSSPDGNTVLIGASYENDGVGAAYVFTKTGTEWNKQKLLPVNNIGGSQFGFSVSICPSGRILAVGGPFDDNDNNPEGIGSNAGAVWIYKLIGSTWTFYMKYSSKVPVNMDGYSVSFDGECNLAVVGMKQISIKKFVS